jgi:putative phosphoribosyl transferase
MFFTPMRTSTFRPLRLRLGGVELEGTLSMPVDPRGLIVIPNASGDTTYKSSNDHLAVHLRDEGFATLTIDLLSHEEAREDAETSELRFDVPFVAARLLEVSEWATERPWMRGLTYGYLAAGISAATALVAAAERPHGLQAVVCCGARTDLAKGLLDSIDVPTLLLVGSRDSAHLSANTHALAHLPRGSRLELVPGGGHLLDDRWAVEHVSACAGDWFGRALTRDPAITFATLTVF